MLLPGGLSATLRIDPWKSRHLRSDPEADLGQPGVVERGLEAD